MQRSEGKMRTDVLRPCKYHTEMLAGFREYIDTSEASVQQRQTIQDEVDVLNQAIKDGLGEHVARPGYQPIPHRAEWQEQEQEAETDESALERRVRELEEQNWHLRTDMMELERQPDTREVGTQTDP